MTGPKDAGNESVRDFVVVTEVKPDGRLIHYYEWPDRAPEPTEGQPDKAASRDADV